MIVSNGILLKVFFKWTSIGSLLRCVEVITLRLCRALSCLLSPISRIEEWRNSVRHEESVSALLERKRSLVIPFARGNQAKMLVHLMRTLLLGWQRVDF